MKPYPYQQTIIDQTFSNWSYGIKNVLVVAPTGSGKTVIMSNIVQRMNVPTIVIAHRQELVGQMSLTLAKFGIQHRIVGPNSLIRNINQLHVMVLGKSFYNPDSPIGVAGINTLVRRGDKLKSWLRTIKLWVLDEAHHLLKSNIWGRGLDMLPANVLGLGVTATPCRSDGAGLGAHADGVFDTMVTGPTGRELINEGFLCDYRIFAPPCDINFQNVKISKTTGDYIDKQLVKATRASTIIGDIVGEYSKHALGKLGVTFMPSVDLAQDTADMFNTAGIPAIMLHGGTGDVDRVKALRKFKNREYFQLVNVGLFGEGFDLPALEVVSMGSRTESFSKYSQQFGRALRTMDGKSHAIIIDHVGNVMRHGLPDTPRQWTLDRIEKKAKADPDLLPVRTCTNCTAVYESWEKVCPFCGFKHIPADRSCPEMVEGDLQELDHDVLMALRGEITRIDAPPDGVRDNLIMAGAPNVVAYSAAKNHRVRQEVQTILRQSIAQWAGYHRVANRSDSEIHKRFFRGFGIDIMSAQALGKPDAEKLNEQINSRMGV